MREGEPAPAPPFDPAAFAAFGEDEWPTLRVAEPPAEDDAACPVREAAAAFTERPGLVGARRPPSRALLMWR